ncbi:helix-turn-helix transcriptional regulator [Endozoicomonas sp. SM1973]|uniref:Helix-turn-helix transcriptional regulator n=1 Tax=Spartinivicinus marinus TaxID=2994442 RepID=A0A853IKM0_9GAMM|nr:helix-turn-helix transcriptional regulator [Spartinivicinus marinus]MCX4027960.1 helix-turn-helix transcriptional regulator [Spartinivicinus marinus]NYZ68236.1 helix-turn-helix transcriptional regulator [Spartinivicinus marinus]
MKRSTKVTQEVKAIGDRLRHAINSHSLSVEQIGQKVGLSPTQIYDRIRYGNLRLHEAVALGRLLGIDLEWLATGYEDIPNLEGVVAKLSELHKTKPQTVESFLLTIDRLWLEEQLGSHK